MPARGASRVKVRSGSRSRRPGSGRHAGPGSVTRYPLSERNSPPSIRDDWQAATLTSTAHTSASRTPCGRRARLASARGAMRPARGVTASQLGEDPPQRDAPATEEDHAVEPEIGDLGDDPLVAFAAEGRGDHLRGLLADLAADHRLTALEEGRHVGALGTLGLARLDHALDHLQRGGARETGGRRLAAGQTREEAGARAGVAGDAFLVHLEQQRVAVTVGEHRVDVLHVPRRLALAPWAPA